MEREGPRKEAERKATVAPSLLSLRRQEGVARGGQIPFPSLCPHGLSSSPPLLMRMPRKWHIKGLLFGLLNGKSNEVRKRGSYFYMFWDCFPLFLNVDFRYLNSE